MSFVFLVCSTDTGLCDTPYCCFVAFVYSLRCSHSISRYQFGIESKPWNTGAKLHNDERRVNASAEGG